MNNVTWIHEVETGEACPTCGVELVLGSEDDLDTLECDCSGYLVA